MVRYANRNLKFVDMEFFAMTASGPSKGSTGSRVAGGRRRGAEAAPKPNYEQRDITRFDDAADKDRQFVTALARGLELLRCFGAGERHLGLSELARRAGLPKATVARLAGTLAKLGYLRYSEALGKYSLGTGVLSLGYAMLSNLDIRDVARPLMQELAEHARASVSIGVRDRLSVVYIEWVRSSAPITVMRGIGVRLPIATTSMGRASRPRPATPSATRCWSRCACRTPRRGRVSAKGWSRPGRNTRSAASACRSATGTRTSPASACRSPRRMAPAWHSIAAARPSWSAARCWRTNRPAPRGAGQARGHGPGPVTRAAVQDSRRSAPRQPCPVRAGRRRAPPAAEERTPRAYRSRRRVMVMTRAAVRPHRRIRWIWPIGRQARPLEE